MPAPDARPASASRALLCAVAALVLLAGSAAALLLYARRGPERRAEPPGDEPASFPLPPVSSSPFLNTRQGVAYVGSAACDRCHDGHTRSFHRTGMGRSMAPVDLKREPPDASFDHRPSQRRYQVVRKDGKMYHRELLLTDDKEEIVLSEFPVKYVVGSGRHSLTYVCEVDGFMVESPITWYRAKNAWGMSPGYDRASQQGFERAVGESCLICHVGEARAAGETLHRMTITEPAIGCERCHGPGSLHVRRHDAKEPPPPGIDRTIVNPARLSRDLAEAVCSQCHLRSSAAVVARGRTVNDFRPGLPLEDFRHDFRIDAPDKAMSVVGHVEQMHLSRCYQESKAFSCQSCHDPHDEPTPEGREAHYRAACLKCHQEAHCKVDPAVRRWRSPGNDCVSCHMPTSQTEIPHLAFTHHRVGIHDAANPLKPSLDPPPVFAELVPVLDLSRVPEIDRRRSMGLGYLDVGNVTRDDDLASRYLARGIDLLRQVREQGLLDGAVDAAMARALSELGRPDVSLAEIALTHKDLDPLDRCNATFLLAEGLARGQGRRAEAIPLLRRLATLRRHSVPLTLLADCEKSVGDPAYVETLEAVVRINPRLWKIHEDLARHYRRAGDKEKAAYHRKRAVP